MTKGSKGLANEQRKRVIESQRYALLQHGYHPHSLLWSSIDVQELRFKILAQIGITTSDSVLDIGCGFGDLADYLMRQNIIVDYIGVDVSEELLIEGRKHYPKLRLVQGDIFDFDPLPQSVDYVVLSGALNRKFEGAVDYTQQVIQQMFDTCRKGIAFNLLDARHEWTANRWDLQSFYPEEIIHFCKRGFSQAPTRVEVIEGYLENDFTVYLRR